MKTPVYKIQVYMSEEWVVLDADHIRVAERLSEEQADRVVDAINNASQAAAMREFIEEIVNSHGLVDDPRMHIKARQLLNPTGA
jgi:hypothetical protein